MDSIKINNWDLYNVDNVLRFQYEPDQSHFEMKVVPHNIKLGEVININTNFFALEFDNTKFSELFDYYGIKRIYSDEQVQVKIKYSSNITWDLSQNPFTVIPKSELEKGLTIYMYYANEPETVLFNIYPIVNNGSSSFVESIEFGVKLK